MIVPCKSSTLQLNDYIDFFAVLDFRRQTFRSAFGFEGQCPKSYQSFASLVWSTKVPLEWSHTWISSWLETHEVRDVWATVKLCWFKVVHIYVKVKPFESLHLKWDILFLPLLLIAHILYLVMYIELFLKNMFY